jgi:DNA-binding transcriptional ArsR family regulator
MFFKLASKKTGQGRPKTSKSTSTSTTYTRPRRRQGGSHDKSRATTVMKALSNSQRLQILSHLVDGEERSVKELEDMIRTLSQSALSQHLGRLRRANILKARRDSQMVYYSMEDKNVEKIISLLNAMYSGDPVLNSRSHY